MKKFFFLHTTTLNIVQYPNVILPWGNGGRGGTNMFSNLLALSDRLGVVSEWLRAFSVKLWFQVLWDLINERISKLKS